VLPVEINLPQSADIYEANHPTTTLDKLELAEKLATPELRELLSQPSIIIINDHHRSTPTGRILEVLAELYADQAQLDYIVIAGGSHDEPSDKQLSKLTHKTEELFDCELLIHDPKEEEIELTYLGTTSRGTEVKVHPVLLDYNNIICINSVEPHYFAGFTGGVKSIIPGLAALSTIEKNHSWALSADSWPGNVETNPLQLDLWEGADMLEKKFFGIQLVNFQDEIFTLELGELKTAWKAAVEFSKSVYITTVKRKYDVIVSIVYPPLDRSLYQAQKGIENTRQALKDGGEMILVANCEDGIGNSAFYETLKQFDTPSEIIGSIKQEEYQFGDHKVYKFATLAASSQLTFVGDLSLGQAKTVFGKSIRFDELEDYLNSLVQAGKKIALVLDSGSLVLNN